AVRTGKPRSIQKLSLFQYSGWPVLGWKRRNVPRPLTRFFTSPPPSSGGGKPGFSAGSGRRVVYLNQGGGWAVGDHQGFGRAGARADTAPGVGQGAGPRHHPGGETEENTPRPARRPPRRKNHIRGGRGEGGFNPAGVGAAGGRRGRPPAEPLRVAEEARRRR